MRDCALNEFVSHEYLSKEAQQKLKTILSLLMIGDKLSDVPYEGILYWDNNVLKAYLSDDVVIHFNIAHRKELLDDDMVSRLQLVYLGGVEKAC